MSPEEMLTEISLHGEDLNADYDDSLAGWFAWKISPKDSELTVIYEPHLRKTDSVGPAIVHRWKLVFID